MLDDNDIISIALKKPENQDIVDELNDSKFETRTHGSKATSAKGCRGPLCRKAERDAKASSARAAAILDGRDYTPRKSAARERDEFLEKVHAWHIYTRELLALVSSTEK